MQEAVSFTRDSLFTQKENTMQNLLKPFMTIFIMMSMIFCNTSCNDNENNNNQPPQTSDSKFKISITETGSTWTRFDIETSDTSIKYMVFTRPTTELEQFQTENDLFQADMAEYQSYADSYGMTLMELLTEYQFLNSGNQRQATKTLLKPSLEYYLYCYGISEEGELMTAVYKEKFFTTSPSPVNNEITITIPDSTLMATTAIVQVSTTTPDAYSLGVFTSDNIPTDEDIIKILASGNLGLYAEREEFMLFENPNTNYTVIAMGVAGETPTTRLFKQEFKTKEPQVVENLTMDIQTKIFTSEDVAEHTQTPIGKGQYIVAQKTISNGNAIMSCFFDKTDFETAIAEIKNNPDNDKLTDEEIYMSIINNTLSEAPQNVSFDWTNLWLAETEEEYVVASMVYDEAQLHYKADTASVTVKAELCSPISEFDDFMYTTQFKTRQQAQIPYSNIRKIQSALHTENLQNHEIIPLNKNIRINPKTPIP